MRSTERPVQVQRESCPSLGWQRVFSLGILFRQVPGVFALKMRVFHLPAGGGGGRDKLYQLVIVNSEHGAQAHCSAPNVTGYEFPVFVLISSSLTLVFTAWLCHGVPSVTFYSWSPKWDIKVNLSEWSHCGPENSNSSSINFRLQEK